MSAALLDLAVNYGRRVRAEWAVRPLTMASADVSEADPGVPSESDPGIPQTNTSGTGATKDPDISWKHFPMRILEDQKDLWLFPTQLARGKHWVPTVTVTLVTGALIARRPAR